MKEFPSSKEYKLQPAPVKQWGEQKVFNVGYAYQQATDWHKKHPRI